MPRKRAIVTGASGGLGLEFATLLAADAYDLTLVARSREALEKLAASLHARYGIEATAIALDLADTDAVQRLCDRVPDCDVLVNNAAFGSNGRFDTIDAWRIRAEVQLDVMALTLLARAYLPGMIERRSGAILNVASTAGLLPGPFMAVYYASKAYVISFSQALWEELRGTGVTVTCFCPGATATGFAANAGMQGTLLFKLPVASAGRMARAGYRAMRQGRLMAVPWPPANWAVELFARLTPRRPLLWLSRKAVETPR